MINDLINVFKRDDLTNVILDNYTPKWGLYARINKDNSIDYFEMKKDSSVNDSLYEWFKKADYYSKVLELNKSVDPKKKIHSNNIYTVFCKCDTIVKEKNKVENEEFVKSVERYFSAFLTIKKEHKDLLDENLFSPLIKDDIDKNKQKILNRKQLIILKIIELDIKPNMYIKIFLQEDMEIYFREYQRYTVPRIFNKNKFNIEKNSEIYGLSNSNMGLNEKKPYLEHMTTNFGVPYRVNLKNAIVIKQIFEWLEAQKDKGGNNINFFHIPVDYDFKTSLTEENFKQNKASYYLYIIRGKETIVEDFDYLDHYLDKINELKIFNYVQKVKFDDDILISRSKFEILFDKLFFLNKLRISYYSDPGGYNKRLNTLIIIYRNVLLDYFKKGREELFPQCVDAIMWESILIQLCTEKEILYSDIQKLVNVYFSVIVHFNKGGKREMAEMIIPIWEGLLYKVKTKINEVDRPVILENDAEFYFAAGQLVYYLSSMSEAEKMNFSHLDKFLRSKNIERFKQEIQYLFEKYNHAISIYQESFKNIFSMVMGYEPEEKKVNKELFLAGFTSKNILYTKQEEEK